MQEREALERVRLGVRGEAREAGVRDAFERFEAQGLESGEIEERGVVEVVGVEFGDVQVFEGGEQGEDFHEDVVLEDAGV